MSRCFTALLLALAVCLTACVARPAAPSWMGAAYAPPARGAAPTVQALTALGRAMFFDPSLSASGKTACSTCHDPGFAYGPPNALSVQLAGRDGHTPGPRAAPSLRYLQTLPPFSEHHFDNDGDDSIDAGPTGGHTWDGRASSAHEQASLPLLSPAEMANSSPAEVVERLQRSAYAEQFRHTFGSAVFADPQAAFASALLALEVFQQSPRDFYPYTSKYDAVLRGQARLSEQEARGLAVFDDPGKGNCASCHLSAPTMDGAFPLFTDFGLIALGVPRHRGLQANADPRYADMGLCGPIRTDFQKREDYCGLFRTPSLRNVAVRQSFFHNGVFHTLKEALQFYARRDTEPERFYASAADGKPQKFDDLDQRYHANVNIEPPFDRKPGDTPAFSDEDIDDMVAFLQTLTDADAVAGAGAGAGAGVTVGVVNDDEVGKAFARFDPRYPQEIRRRREALRLIHEQRMMPMATQMDAASGKPAFDMACSNQILKELLWRVSSTADFAAMDRRIEDLKAELAQAGNAAHTAQVAASAQSPVDGSWGPCYQPWFFKLTDSYDQFRTVLSSGKPLLYPLAYLDRIRTRKQLSDYLDSILVSDIARTGIDSRRELNESFSTIIRMVLRNQPPGVFEPGAQQDVLDFVARWQNPQSGYWGARYTGTGDEIPMGSAGRVVQQDDLSITFHLIGYMGGKVDHWDRILDSTLDNIGRNTPQGALFRGAQNNHMYMDVARIFRLGWKHASDTQKTRIRTVMKTMLDFCLNDSLQADGSFKPSLIDPTVGEQFYFGVALLDETGYLTPSRRFWTSDAFPQAESVRSRIRARIEQLRPAGGAADSYLQSALELLDGN